MKTAVRPLLRRLGVLHDRIAAGTYPNASSLAVELEVHPRTIHRDIDFLRNELRAPVEFSGQHNGYYYREPCYALPLLSLSQGELVALFLAERLLQHYQGTPLIGDLTAAFRKLTVGLPDAVTIRLEDLARSCSVVGPLPTRAEAQRFSRLVVATQEGRQLELVYWTASRDDESRRVIDPYHLVSIEGEWYLVAYCHLREAIRMFVPGRIRSLRETGERFERPADFRIGEYLEGSFGAMRGEGPLQTVRLLFTPQAGRYMREKVWHPSQKFHMRRDGWVELSLRLNQLFEVKRWVLSYGAECVVLAPEELRRQVGEELRRAANSYPATGGGEV